MSLFVFRSSDLLRSALDTRTILIAAALTILANGAILALLQRLLPIGEQAAVKTWQLGTLLIAAGCIAFSFKAVLPPPLKLTVPNALIMLGLATYWHSVLLLCHQTRKNTWLLAPVTIATAAVYIFDIHYPDTWLRILFVAFAWMFLMFGSATTLYRHTHIDTPGSQRALTWLFFAVGFYTMLRLLFYSQIDLLTGFDVTDNQHWVTQVSPLLALALPVLGSTSFVLLFFERVRAHGRRQTEALGYISHDLRAPAATIRGYVDLLRTSLPAGHASHLQAIQRSADNQILLIDELLEFSKQELKPLNIHPAATNLEEFLASVFDQGQDLCRQHGNRFTIVANTPLPVNISADARRLSQTLLNLISNAAAFTREGKVVLSLSSTPDGPDALLDFAVQDNGPGIPATQQARVFDAFEQVQSRDGSVGLGLHIAKSIVHNMGGVLQLESSPGAGASFSFRLRVPVVSAEVFRPAHKASPDADSRANQIASIVVPPSIQAALDDLAQYAKLGEITRIEQWLAEHLDRYPSAEQFLRQVEHAAARLDLVRIEQLACSAAPLDAPPQPRGV